MKFKVSAGNETYEKFMALREKIDLVNTESEAVVESLGGKRYCKGHNVAYGGIAAIQFLRQPPQGFKMVGESYRNLYYPKATQKELIKKFNLLPTIRYDEINDIVNFHAPQTINSGEGLQWISCIGLHWGKEDVLITIPDGAKYTAPKHVIEILESEYERLSNNQ